MFVFRINKVRIIDNHKGGGFLGLGHDRIDVQLLSFVTTGNMDLPNLQGFLDATDATTKANILKGWVQSVAASRILTPISRVTDKFTATFGTAGYALYESETIPDEFSWEFIAVKSNDRTRNLGTKLDGIAKSSDLSTFTSGLGAILGAATNPVFTAAVAVSKFVLNQVALWISQEPDDELGLYYESLTRAEHYQFGERKKDDVADLTGNMFVDYSLFGVDKKK